MIEIALASAGFFALGYSLGWRTRDRQKQQRADERRELRMMLSGRVIDAEVELAREVA